MFPILLAALALAGPAAAQQFSPADIAGWRPHSFSGATRYALTEAAGEAALHATCENAASGLFLEREIDLRATPILEWRWRVLETFPPGPAETPRRATTIRRASTWSAGPRCRGGRGR
jgi:hypothetical protein